MLSDLCATRTSLIRSKPMSLLVMYRPAANGALVQPPLELKIWGCDSRTWAACNVECSLGLAAPQSYIAHQCLGELRRVAART